MSLTTAVAEIHQAMAASGRERELRFKRRQHAIDELIEETEVLVMDGALQVPAWLLDRAQGVVSAALGRVPPWFGPATGPEALLNHLFVAEGLLRRRYYADVQIDPTD